MKIQLLLIVILTAFTAVEAKETKKVPAGQIAYYSFDQDTKDCLKDSVSGLNFEACDIGYSDLRVHREETSCYNL